MNGYIVKSGTMDRFVSNDQVDGKSDLRLIARFAIREHIAKSNHSPIGLTVEVYAANGYGRSGNLRNFQQAKDCLLKTSVWNLRYIGIDNWVLVKVDEKNLHGKIDRLLSQLVDLQKRVEEYGKNEDAKIGFLRWIFKKIW